MSLTLFKKTKVNLSKLLPVYNIYVHEDIDGKKTVYSNMFLKKKTPLYSKYKKKKNSYTRQCIGKDDITYYQCLFIDIVIAKINEECLMIIYNNHSIHFFNSIDLLFSSLFSNGYFSNSSGCACEMCNEKKIQEYQQLSGLNIGSVGFIKYEIRSL